MPLLDRRRDGPDEADSAATKTDEPIESRVLEIERPSQESAAERTYNRCLWLFVVTGLTGSAIGLIARWRGARGRAVALAIWPLWFLGILSMAVPSCAG